MITGNEYELKLLGDYVSYPEETRRCIEKFLVTDEAFTNDNCRAAFHLLNEAKDISNESERFKIVAEALNLDTTNSEARNELQNDYTDPIPSAIQVTAHHLAMNLYNSRVREASILATNSCDDCADGESLQEKVRLAIEEIPKPPKLGEHTVEAEIAKQLKKDEQEDIPEKLLHVPGFIDDVVDYSLKSAYTPNRTLSFAGALALTAHLAARRYTDKRNTRTNLFVFALGPTGIGKEHPRKLNRLILRKTDPHLSSTIFNEVASGEALEETLHRFPRVLFQMDEVQKQLQALKDERNPNALSLVKFLLTLYSASGSDHTMRAKASAPEQIGRSIWDPALTLFATGISKDSFRALTPSLIKEGLLGRCLMFDSENVGDPNEFKAGIPEPSENLIAKAIEFGNETGGFRDDPETSNPTIVLYEDGVDDHLNGIIKETAKKAKACRDKGDEIGGALWARASEKVTKLALIAAISRERNNTHVRREDVDWAWELVKFLVERMIRRVDMYMAQGRVAEICQAIIDALSKNKGVLTQRQLFRCKKSIVDDNYYQSALKTLKHRGQIDINEPRKDSVLLRLITA